MTDLIGYETNDGLGVALQQLDLVPLVRIEYSHCTVRAFEKVNDTTDGVGRAGVAVDEAFVNTGITLSQ